MSLCAINKTDPAEQTTTNKWHFNGNANHKKALKKSARLSVARGRQNSSVRQRLKQILIAPERLSEGERYTDGHRDRTTKTDVYRRWIKMRRLIGHLLFIFLSDDDVAISTLVHI